VLRRRIRLPRSSYRLRWDLGTGTAPFRYPVMLVEVRDAALVSLEWAGNLQVTGNGVMGRLVSKIFYLSFEHMHEILNVVKQ